MEYELPIPTNVVSKTKWILNVLTCVVVGVMTIYVGYIPFLRYHYLFTWHVVLGAVAYLLLFPPSFLIFDNSWYLHLSRKQKSWIHAVLAGAASVLGLVCVILDYYRKEVYMPQYPDIKHFESAHAITGLLAAIVLIMANISGVLTATVTWFGRKFIRPVSIKLYHNVLGQVAFAMGIISLCLAFHTSWFLYYASLGVSIAITIFTALATIWSLVNSVLSGKDQINILMET